MFLFNKLSLSKYHDWLNKYWPIIIICIFGFIPFLWFLPGYHINGTDLDFSLFPSERFIHRLQTWDIHFVGGSDRSNNVSSLPWVAVGVFFEWLGFDMIMIEKLSFSTWMILVGLSMHFLMRQILENENSISNATARTSASLFYMLNFYNVFLWVRLQLAASTLVLIPVFLGLQVAVYKGKINLGSAFSIITLVAILCGPIGIQPPLIQIMMLFTGGYALYLLMVNAIEKRNLEIKKNIIAFLLLLSGFVIGSAFWILPLGSFIVESGYTNSSVGLDVYSVRSLIDWVSSVTSFHNVFRLFGDVPWFDGWGGERYFPEFLDYQESSVLILMSMVVPMIVFGSLLVKHHENLKQHVVYLFLSLMIALFLSKGNHPPFGDSYNWLIENVPSFWIQRAPWQKFTMVTSLCYAALFGTMCGYGVALASKWTRESLITGNLYVKKASSLIFISIVIAFIVGSNWTFVTGRHFSFGDGDNGYHEKFGLGFHHKYPDYIFEARNFINQQPGDFKIFFLPDDKVSVYDWGYGGSGDIALQLFEKGLIHRQYGEGMVPPNTVDSMQQIITQKLYSSPSESVTFLLGMLNVKYIIQRNDFRYDFFGDTDSPSFISKQLGKVPGITKVKTFGMWDIYEVASRYQKPQIYIGAETVDLSRYRTQEERFNALLNLIDENDKSNSNGVIVWNRFSSDEIDKLDDNIFNSSKTFSTEKTGSLNPTARYRRISATKYIVRIRNASNIVSLVFSEGFHRKWRAYLMPTDNVGENSVINTSLSGGAFFQTWFASPWGTTNTTEKVVRLPDTSHKVGNGFANAWLINVNQICALPSYCKKSPEGEMEFDVILEFWPQNLFIIGVLITLFGGSLSFIYLVTCRLRSLH